MTEKHKTGVADLDREEIFQRAIEKLCEDVGLIRENLARNNEILARLVDDIRKNMDRVSAIDSRLIVVEQHPMSCPMRAELEKMKADSGWMRTIGYLCGGGLIVFLFEWLKFRLHWGQ